MPRTTKSGWDFGELFPPEQTRRVLTVSELTTQVKRLLAANFGVVWVSGEISNFRRQASGHCYFTLKDAAAQLACVLFRGEARAGRELLEDGRKVLLQGDLTVYEPRGQYQLVVKAVELQGVGALQLAFERLKLKLQAEGLFAPERKRPLPLYPEGLGIVSSPTGAALRDVLHVVQRRQPSLDILLAPCRVQGEGAAAEVARAIGWLNTLPAPRPDLILVTRGGGSIEDLWAFNEEAVARAIFESALPIVSAVGHEVDFTIADFVADLRAATPSAAAELITQATFAARELVRETLLRLPRLAAEHTAGWRTEVAELQARMTRAHPRRRINEAGQRLDDLLGAVARAARFRCRELRTRWDALRTTWLRLHPRRHLDQRREVLTRLGLRLAELARQGHSRHRQDFHSLHERLRLLSPEHTLARGYSITTDLASGQIIRSVQQVGPTQRLRTRVRDGAFESDVAP